MAAAAHVGFSLVFAGVCHAQLVVDSSLGNSPYTVKTNTTLTSAVVGNTADGILNQTAGTFTLNSLRLGETATGSGQYVFSGGTLSVGSLIVGNAGTGTVQSASNGQIGSLILGQAAGSSGTFNVTSGTLDFGYLNGGVSPPSPTYVVTVGGSGAGAMTVTNASVGTNNYDIVIASAAGSSGVLRLNSGSTLFARSIRGGAGSSLLIFDGGTVVPGYYTSTLFSNLRGMRVSTGGVTIDVDALSVRQVSLPGTLTHDPSILTADGGLRLTGGGVLSISGPQHYTGPTTIADGKIYLSNSNGLGDGGLIRFTGGALLQENGMNADLSSRFSTENDQNIRIGVSNSVQTTGPITLASNLSGARTRFEAMGGTITLSGVNTYTGNTLASVGKLIAARKESLPGFDSPGRVSVANGATLAVNAGAWSGADITRLSQNASFAAGSTLALEAVGSQAIISDSFGGSVPYSKTGAGTLVLTGTNSFTGGLHVAEGTAIAASPAALPGYGTPGKTIVDGNTVLGVRVGGVGQWSVADITTLRTSVAFGYNSFFGLDAADAPDNYVFTGPITGSVGVTKVGEGSLRIADLSLAGPLAVHAGTLIVPAGAAISCGSLALNYGGRMDINGTVNCDPAQKSTLGGATVVNIAGTLNVGALDVGSGTFASQVLQTGGTLNATKQVHLGSPSGGSTRYTLNGGRIIADSLTVNGLGYYISELKPNVFTLNDGELRLTSTTDGLVVGSSQGEAVFDQNGGSVDIAGKGLILYTFAYGSARYRLGGGTLSTFSVFRDASLGSGIFQFDGGTLLPKASSNAFVTTLPSMNVLAGGARIDTNGFNISIAPPLLHDRAMGTLPDGGLTKLGTGRLTLTGANTYTGTTTVAGGTLAASPAAYTRFFASGVQFTDARTSLQLAYGTAASPAASVDQAIASHVFGTTLSGNGIVLGYGDNGSTVTVLPTLAGDADLDGDVDFNDFLVLQNNFGQTGTRFDQGDFNYDDVTDFNDFLALQNQFGQSVFGAAVPVSAAQRAAMTAFAMTEAVPEPAAILPALLVGATLLRRRAMPTGN